jgi:hypothetical protein
MSQIASKVRCSPSQHAVVALSSDAVEHALGPLLRLLRRHCHCQCSIAHIRLSETRPNRAQC